MLKFSSLLCGLLVMVGHVSQAQNSGSSPYSRYGIGELNDSNGNVRNFGMGNLGVAMPSAFHVNFLNPALLYYNTRVTFEMAVTGEVKNIANSGGSQNAGNGGLGYLALSVPVNKSWRSAVGLRPFSVVNFRSYRETTVIGAPEQTRIIAGENGEGNLSEVYFANGVKIAKGLTAGVTGSYIFGVIDRDSYSILADSAGLARQESTVLNSRTNYSDVIFKAGVAYKYSINKDLNLNLGAIYGLEANVNYGSRTIQERRTPGGFVPTDRNFLGDSIESEATLPGYIQGGFSFDNGKSWSLGVEVTSRNWSSSTLNTGSSKFGNSYRVAVGGEYTPDPAAGNNYLKMVGYRAGVSYAKPAIEPNGNQIRDVAIHAGLTLPINAGVRGPDPYYSMINVGIAAGKNGTTESNLVRENYLRFMVGLSLNTLWFQKRKIE